jgi:hypothetical protein
MKTSRQIYDESIGIRRQTDDGRHRLSEDDQQREQFGPRGVRGKSDPAKMVPQRRKGVARSALPSIKPGLAHRR